MVLSWNIQGDFKKKIFLLESFLQINPCNVMFIQESKHMDPISIEENEWISLNFHVFSKQEIEKKN